MIPIPIKIPDDNVAPIRLRPVMPSYIVITPGMSSMITAPSAPPSDI